MSETVNNTNTSATVDSNPAETTSENELALSEEQQRIIDLCAREQALAAREKIMAKREIDAYATDSLSQLGFNDNEIELAFGIINLNDKDSCKASIDALSQLCEIRAINITNSRLRAKSIPKGCINTSIKSNEQSTTFKSEVEHLKNR